MNLFDYSQEFDVEEFLEESQERERKRLERQLDRIDKQLDERDQLHEDLIDEFESKRDWYLERLEKLYLRNMGKHGEREDLKRKVEEFYQLIREEKRSHWEDRQELERERRTVLQELAQLDEEDILDLL